MEEQLHAQFYKAEPKISITNLSKLKQRLDEPTKSFFERVKRLKNRCTIQLRESQMKDLALGSLNLEFRKNFDGHAFKDICELGTKVTKFRNLINEENKMKNSSIGTYYTDSNHCANLDIDPSILEKLIK